MKIIIEWGNILDQKYILSLLSQHPFFVWKNSHQKKELCGCTESKPHKPFTSNFCQLRQDLSKILYSDKTGFQLPQNHWAIEAKSVLSSQLRTLTQDQQTVLNRELSSWFSSILFNNKNKPTQAQNMGKETGHWTCDSFIFSIIFSFLLNLI